MSNFLIILPILAASLFLVYGQSSTCSTDSINQFIQCIAAVGQDKRQQMQADMETKKQAADNCFSQFSCQNEMACFAAIKDSKKSQIESCVQSTTGFNVQDLDGFGHHHGFDMKGGHGGMFGGRGRGKRGFGWGGESRADDFTAACNGNSDAASQLQQCLQSLHSTESPRTRDPSQNITAEIQQLCAQADSCVSTLKSNGCNDSDISAAVKKGFEAYKTCAEQQMNTSSDLSQAASGISQCSGVNLTALTEKHRNHFGAGRKEGRGRQGRGAHMMMGNEGRDQSFSLRNPCNQNTQPEQGGRYFGRGEQYQQGGRGFGGRGGRGGREGGRTRN